MENPAAFITEKLMDTIGGLVYLALRFRRRRGATAADLSDYVNARIPSEHRLHAGLVEQVRCEPGAEGLATREGERWFPGGAAA
jgi:hypothetical protein